jgi:hypothetical protein
MGFRGLDRRREKRRGGSIREKLEGPIGRFREKHRTVCAIRGPGACPQLPALVLRGFPRGAILNSVVHGSARLGVANSGAAMCGAAHPAKSPSTDDFVGLDVDRSPLSRRIQEGVFEAQCAAKSVTKAPFRVCRSGGADATTTFGWAVNELMMFKKIHLSCRVHLPIPC